MSLQETDSVEVTNETEGQQVDSAAQDQNPPAGDSGKLYTLDEMNAHADHVVKTRIDKQNAKHAEDLAAKDAELAEDQAKINDLQERVAFYEAKEAREKAVQNVSAATGLSSDQVRVLQGDAEEELSASAEVLKKAMPSFYPVVPNTDQTPPPLSKEDIKSIKNTEERIAAMGKHPELFK